MLGKGEFLENLDGQCIEQLSPSPLQNSNKTTRRSVSITLRHAWDGN